MAAPWSEQFMDLVGAEHAFSPGVWKGGWSHVRNATDEKRTYRFLSLKHSYYILCQWEFKALLFAPSRRSGRWEEGSCFRDEGTSSVRMRQNQKRRNRPISVFFFSLPGSTWWTHRVLITHLSVKTLHQMLRPDGNSPMSLGTSGLGSSPSPHLSICLFSKENKVSQLGLTYQDNFSGS